MSLEENKALIRRVYELFNRRELDAIPELSTPGYVEHYTGSDVPGEQVMKFTSAFFAAFPDVNFTIEDMVAEGDKVAVRVNWKGTHKGVFMGIAPTGNKINITNTGIFRITGGKGAECWATMDMFNLMQQIGAIPKRER
jgi:predicted ester cyclase